MGFSGSLKALCRQKSAACTPCTSLYRAENGHTYPGELMYTTVRTEQVCRDRGINTLRTKAAQQLHRDYHIHYTQSKNHLGIAVEFCGNMSEPRYDGVLAEDACPAYLK